MSGKGTDERVDLIRFLPNVWWRGLRTECMPNTLYSEFSSAVRRTALAGKDELKFEERMQMTEGSKNQSSVSICLRATKLLE